MRKVVAGLFISLDDVTDSKMTSTGVAILTYQPRESRV